jgi:glycine betaine catabolism B
VLPKDPNKKLLFIAGGIGVTPFRSMIKELVLRKEERDITLFYFANSEEEVLYKDLWQEAFNYGVKVIPFTNREKLDEVLLKKHAPDFKQRYFYLSGPPFMVRAYVKVLRELNISRRNIYTDYFSGY